MDTKAQQAWRDGYAPLLTERGLRALREALLNKSTELIRGAITRPAPFYSVREWLCEGGCAIGYAIWKGEGLKSVGEIFDRFNIVSDTAHLKMRQSCHPFIDWFDDPKILFDDIRVSLITEIDIELNKRNQSVPMDLDVRRLGRPPAG